MIFASSDRTSDFPHRMAGHCGSGALRDLLQLHGLDYGAGPLSEGFVFGLAGGLGFLLLEPRNAHHPIYLLGRTTEFERYFAANVGVELDVRESDDPGEGWRWVREQIDAGRPPIVWADIAQLEYLRVRMSNTRHDIVIVDYDEKAGVAIVADNDREELQRCSLASLAAARGSQGFPGPNRHATFVYDWPHQLVEPERAVRQALRQAIANMRGGTDTLPGLPGIAGLQGVDRLAAVYPSWPHELGDALPGVLQALRIFIVKAGTGGAMFRSLHAEFLRDAAALLSNASLAETAELYDELSNRWKALADCAGAQDHDGGAEQVARIAELEHAGVDAMEAGCEAAD